jgi:hypothetical protein
MAYRRVRNYGYAMGATSGTETPNSYDKWNISVVICDTGIP